MADINRKPPGYDVEPMIAARKSKPEYEKIGEVCPSVCACASGKARWAHPRVGWNGWSGFWYPCLTHCARQRLQ